MADFKRAILQNSYFPLSSNSGISNFALNQNTDTIEYVFNIPEATVITQIGVRYGLRTGTPPTYQISLQGVDGSGLPDESIKASGNAKAIFTPPADTSWNGIFKWFTLDSPYSAARGELLSTVIAHSTGTIDASNNSSFTVFSYGTYGTRAGFPYVIQNDNGSRTRQSTQPVFSFASASKKYGYPMSDKLETVFHADSNPDEYGLVFTLHAGWGDTFQVMGARINMGTPAAGTTLTFTLYDTNGTSILQQIDLDGDVVRAASTACQAIEIYFDEVNLSALNFGSTYYLTVKQAANTNGISLFCWGFDAADSAAAISGGDAFGLCTKVNDGAMSTDYTKRPAIELILNDWTEPVGGGGGLLVHPGMTGGIRG